MSSSLSSSSSSHNKYKGVRQRKWGKWVSEIRVPGTPERLWLGSYATPEAAATAHDVAYYCLRGGDSSLQSLNFPLTNLPTGARVGISPRSVQKVASDAGLAVDARLKVGHTTKKVEDDDKYYSVDQQGNDFNDHNNVIWQQHCSSWGTTSDNNDWWHNTSDRDQEHLNISVEDYM